MKSKYENEEWKSLDFLGYDDYLISNYGRAKSRRNSGKKKIFRFIDGSYYSNGYKRYTLANENGSKLFMAHRLVAMAFLPNPNNLPVVHHKDEDITNNHVSNLKWCTQKDNMEYSGTDKLIKKCVMKKKKPVVMYDKKVKIINYFNCINDCVKYRSDFDSRAIHRCLIGKSSHHKGFIFKFYSNLTYDEKMKVIQFNNIHLINEYRKEINMEDLII